MLVLVNGEYVVLEKVQHEILESPITVYNFQVEDDHTYYVGESSILVHNANCGSVDRMSNMEKNKYARKIMSGDDVTFQTRGDAEMFVKTKFSSYPQEIAGNRSAMGWHYDNHPINNSPNSIPHINIYNKKLSFNAHIFWKRG